MRALIWGIIGLVYAPLFSVLSILFDRLGAGILTYPLAATIAAGAVAVFYGGRMLGLIATSAGLATGTALLMTATELVGFQQAVLIAVGLGALVGISTRLAEGCDRQTPDKTLAGVLTGALCGSLLAVVQLIHPGPLPMFAVVAYLLSVNGVLFVAGVKPVLALTQSIPGAMRPCRLAASLEGAVLAGIAAGSVWIMAGPFLGEPGAWLREVNEAVLEDLPFALLGGIVGGALAGALVQLFGFHWVHEL